MPIPKKFNFDTGVDCSISFVFFEVAKECPVPSVFFRKEIMHRVGDGTRLFLLKHYMGRFDTNDPSKGECCENPIDDEFTDFAMELHGYENSGTCDLSYCNSDNGENPCLLNSNDGSTIDQFDTWFIWGAEKVSCRVERIYADDLEGEKLEAVKQFFPDLFEDIKPTMVPEIHRIKDDYVSLGMISIVVKRTMDLKIVDYKASSNKESGSAIYYLTHMTSKADNPEFVIYIDKQNHRIYCEYTELDILESVKNNTYRNLYDCFDYETGKPTLIFVQMVNELLGHD